MPGLRSLLLTLTVAVLISLLVIPEQMLSARLNHYHDLINRYECFYANHVCNADFNDDGIADLLAREVERSNTRDGEAWLVVSDGTRELFRLRSRYIDNTLRTHVAIRNSSDGARLLVFDGIRTESMPEPIISTAFVWNGETMVPAPTTALDNEILSAMAASDDGGTFEYWSIYGLFKWLFLIAYGLVLVLAAWSSRYFQYSERGSN